MKLFIFPYKLQHKTLPVYFNNFKLTLFSHIPIYDTSNRNLLCPEKVYHELAKHNVRHEIINIWNTFPVDKTSKIHTHSLSGYVTYIKHFIKKVILILVIFSAVIFVDNNLLFVCGVVPHCFYLYSWIWNGVSIALQYGRWTRSCLEMHSV